MYRSVDGRNPAPVYHCPPVTPTFNIERALNQKVFPSECLSILNEGLKRDASKLVQDFVRQLSASFTHKLIDVNGITLLC